MSQATDIKTRQGVFLTGEFLSVNEREWTDREGNTRLSYNVKLLVGDTVMTVGYRAEEDVQAAIGAAVRGDTITVGVYVRANLVGPDGNKEARAFFDGLRANG